MKIPGFASRRDACDSMIWFIIMAKTSMTIMMIGIMMMTMDEEDCEGAADDIVDDVFGGDDHDEMVMMAMITITGKCCSYPSSSVFFIRPDIMSMQKYMSCWP